MYRERVVEEVTIGNKPVQLVHDNVPIDRIALDENNPRIRYRLKLEQAGKSIEDVILGMPELKLLRKDIERNGALRERVILQEVKKRRFRAVEGNCRMVCIESLRKKHPRDPRWKTVPARILPADVDPSQVAVLLSDFHIAGKISWKAHEKAGQVYHMVNELGMTQDDVCTYLRMSKTTVNRLLQAYRLMTDRFLTIDDDKYAAAGQGKWSFFEEFFKQKDLRDELKRDETFGDEFCRWVGEGQLPDGADVRILPVIIRHPEARQAFEATGSLPEAKKIVEAANPELGSDFFRLLEKVRDACTSAAQVKEVLRIRADQTARDRLVATYEALVGFMMLAEVQPERAATTKKKPKKSASSPRKAEGTGARQPAKTL